MVISGEHNRISREEQMSMINLPVKQIKYIPVFLGEKDLLKTLQLLPGIQKGSEGQTGLYVRGGGPDQNLLILDDAPVYNAQHLFGFFSVFNGDALRHVELYKGGFPARFGGRLSSVIDMSMKDGNRERYTGEFGIGIVGSRCVVEGPLIKNKSSFIISFRRTYLDLLIMPFILKQSKGKEAAGYFFYDLNVKLNYDIDDRNKIFLSGYFGRDKFYVKSLEQDFTTNIGWGNATGTLRWNHQFSPKTFSNLSAIVSQYRFFINGEDKVADEKVEYYSGINDFGLKYDFQYLPSTMHTLRMGVQSTFHIFTPKAVVSNVDEEYDKAVNQKQKYHSVENGIYIEDLYKPDSRWQISPGLRYVNYVMKNGISHSLEPRLSASYMISEDLSAKVSYARMKQYLHLLSNTGIGLPTDLWVPATEKVKPQNSQQLALGLAKDMDKGYNVSLEGYYKIMNNVIQYKPGSSFFIDMGDPETGEKTDWQAMVTSGKSWSYGVELFIQKSEGKFSGWVGYTLSWTKMQFDEINFGKEFWARYDRRHDASIVGIYELSPGMRISAVWVYGTGKVSTLPVGTFNPAPHDPLSSFPYAWNGNSSYDYEHINNFREEAYHRLDLSFQFIKEKKRGTRTLELSVYNGYNRKNPYFYNPKEENGERGLVRFSLFPLIPSISYSFKFK